MTSHQTPKVLLLRGVTKKGRELFKIHGRSWTVLETREKVHFSHNKGPWHFCVPSHLKDTPPEIQAKHTRWINGISDTNFIIDEKL